MAKTVFSDTPPQGTIVTAAFLNALNNHRHTGADEDGAGALEYAESTGSANAYVLTLNPALAAHVAGMPIRFKANFANTAAATININNLGAVALKKNYNQALSGNEIRQGQILTICYDGTNYQVIAGLSIGAAYAIPTGAEMLWPTENVPDGWLEENGAEISRTTYAALFAVIGVMYGAGNGSTTFNLPDARGKFPRIWDHGAGVDPDAAARTDRGDETTGDHVGTNQADALKSHSHDVPAQNTATWDGTTVMSDAWRGDYAEHHYPVTATGGNETRPVNTYRMMIIKY